MESGYLAVPTLDCAEGGSRREAASRAMRAANERAMLKLRGFVLDKCARSQIMEFLLSSATVWHMAVAIVYSSTSHAA